MSPCPRCGKTLEQAEERAPSFPFCSPRCKLIDLSKWLSGAYSIPGEPLDPMAPHDDAGDDVPRA